MQSSNELLTEVEGWAAGLVELHARIAPQFGRAEPRQHAFAYLKGLLSPIERKNGWQIAEWVGDETADGMQRLLSSAKWDANLVRDDLQQYVIEQLSDRQAVLVVDETGFPKQGQKSVGVQYQYCGTTGEVENCQVGVFVAYASPKGCTFLDRELYLPQCWCEDRERCREAGIPDSVSFATKGELAQQMIARVMAAGVPFAWVAADALYGSDGNLRTWLENLQVPYVMAVRCDEPVAVMTAQGIRSVAVKDAVQVLTEDGWQRLSMGEGSKGPRSFDWARLPIRHRGMDDQQHWVLIRRSVADPTDFTFYLVYGPIGTSLPEMVRVAGARWKIEEIFEAAKGEIGLDQYEVRLWTCWYRHVTLAMLAHAYRTVVRAHVALEEPCLALESMAGLLPLTVPEIRHLLWQVVWPFQPRLERVLAWSHFRRRHQAHAKRAHTKWRQRRQLDQAEHNAHEQKAHLSRKRPKRQVREQTSRAGARLLTALEYVADDRYLLTCDTQSEAVLQADSAQWVAKLGERSSFRFCGQNGHCTVRKEKQQRGSGAYWIAYRKYQNKHYKHYIGTSATLTPRYLEQVAAALQSRIG
jgi:SRSO17 transposase